MKSVSACRNLDHIRAAVNTIDLQIVKLFGKRTQYARAAFAFKTDRKSIGRPAHHRKVVTQRKVWATQHGADPRMVEKIYQAVVAESKRVHLAAFRAKQRKATK
jgi:isochorismate pyruvate lyase